MLTPSCRLLWASPSASSKTSAQMKRRSMSCMRSTWMRCNGYGTNGRMSSRRTERASLRLLSRVAWIYGTLNRFCGVAGRSDSWNQCPSHHGLGGVDRLAKGRSRLLRWCCTIKGKGQAVKIIMMNSYQSSSDMSAVQKYDKDLLIGSCRTPQKCKVSPVRRYGYHEPYGIQRLAIMMPFVAHYPRPVSVRRTMHDISVKLVSFQPLPINFVPHHGRP